MGDCFHGQALRAVPNDTVDERFSFSWIEVTDALAVKVDGAVRLLEDRRPADEELRPSELDDPTAGDVDRGEHGATLAVGCVKPHRRVAAVIPVELAGEHVDVLEVGRRLLEGYIAVGAARVVVEHDFLRLGYEIL